MDGGRRVATWGIDRRKDDPVESALRLDFGLARAGTTGSRGEWGRVYAALYGTRVRELAWLLALDALPVGRRGQK